ncbi:Para-nitrobenzyl esterase [compost metagenome]
MQKLAESMHAAWIAFAHRGDPATSELSWPEYNLEGRPTLIFDEEMRVTQDPDSEKRKRIVSILV